MTESNPVWTMEQVGDVSRLWIEARIDLSYYWMAGEAVIDAAKAQAAAGLCDEAHTFGVEAHPDDVSFDVAHGDQHITVRAAWHPSTRNVELLGGLSDGRTIEVVDPWDPLEIPLPSTPIAYRRDELPDPALAVEEYRIVGWRERDRRWVMSPA